MEFYFYVVALIMLVSNYMMYRTWHGEREWRKKEAKARHEVEQALQQANDAREIAEAQLRHKTATNVRLVERLTALGDTDEALWGDHSKTLRRFGDKFDKGAGKALPFPQLYDANLQHKG